MNFAMICNYLAARRCYNSGQTVKAIAESAKRSQGTVYRWLRATKGYHET